jgi:hypothetical protein
MILTTFCNSNDHTRLLGELRYKEGEGADMLFKMKYIHGQPGWTGARGIARLPGGYAVGVETNQPEANTAIWFLHEDFKTSHWYIPRLVQSVHEMVFVPGAPARIYCISTQYNAIVYLELDDKGKVTGEGIYFKFHTAQVDHCHLNSLYYLGTESGWPYFLVSMFGHGFRGNKNMFLGSLVKVTPDGPVTLKEGIYEPHSIRYCNGSFVYCESGMKKFVCEDETQIRLPGYTRGVDFDEMFYYVGLSEDREISLSTGQRRPEFDPSARAGVTILSREKKGKVLSIPIPEVSEVFDVVRI